MASMNDPNVRSEVSTIPREGHGRIHALLWTCSPSYFGIKVAVVAKEAS
jgi:hypothetical protein